MNAEAPWLDAPVADDKEPWNSAPVVEDKEQPWVSAPIVDETTAPPAPADATSPLVSPAEQPGFEQAIQGFGTNNKTLIEQRVPGFEKLSPTEQVTTALMTPTMDLVPKLDTKTAGTLARATDVGGIYHLLPKEASDRTAGIVENVVADTANFFTSPVGIATLGLGSAPAGLQKLVGGLFAAHAAKESPEAWRAVIDAKTPEERDKALTGALENTMVLAGGGLHAKELFSPKELAAPLGELAKSKATTESPTGLPPETSSPTADSLAEAAKTGEGAQPLSNAGAAEATPTEQSTALDAVPAPISPETLAEPVGVERAAPVESTGPDLENHTRESVAEMDSGQLKMAADFAKMDDKQLLIRLFGEDGAKRYNKLQRQQESYNNKVADAAFEEVSKMEEGLTEAQRNKLFGVNEGGLSPEDLRDLSSKSEGVASSATPEELGFELKWAAANFTNKPIPDMTPKEFEAHVLFKEAARTIERNKMNPDEVFKEVIKHASSRFKSVGDARLVLSEIIKAGEQAKTPKLPAPSTTPLAEPAVVERSATVGEAPKAEVEAGYVGGPGAMGPVEAAEMAANTKTTGLKRDVVDTERLSRGAEPIPTTERQREAGVVSAAEDRVDADPTVAPSLVARIVDQGEKAISEHDAAVLLVERQRVMNEREAWEERLGKGEEVETAKARLSELENSLERLDQAQRAAGTTWGRLGHMYRRLIREDFSLEAMERKVRAKVERPLTEDERATIKTQAAKIEELQKAAEASKTAEGDAHIDAETQRIYEATINELGKSYLEKPAYGKQVFDIARNVVDRWKSEAETAHTELRKALGLQLAGVPNPVIVLHVAKILRAKIGEFGLNKAEAFAEMASEFGDKIKPHLNAAWSKAQELIGGEKTDFKVKEVVRKGVKKQGEATPESIKARAKAEATASEPLSHRTVYDYVRALINSGVHGTDALMKAAHEGLKEYYPDATERDIRRAYSEYGKVKFPSKEATEVELRESRTIVRLQESIDRLTEGKDAMHTGLQRDKATQEIREKQKQLNELLKQRQGPPSPEKLASREEAKQTALRNAIADLDKQLKTGEKPVKGEPAPDSPQTEQLKAERDAMKAKLAEIEEAANPPPPEHIQELRKLQDRIDETRDRLARLDLERPPGKATVDTPEIAAAKAELKSLNDTITELRKPKPKSDAEKQVEALSKVRDRIDETLSGKRPPNAPKDFDPLSAAAEDIKAEILAMHELAAQMRRDAKPPGDPGAKSESLKIKALEDSIARYEQKMAASDFSTKGKKAGPDSQRVAELKAIRDARIDAYNAAKKAGRPVRTKEEIYNATRMKAVEKQIAELEAKIAAGNFTRKVKSVPPDKTQAVKDAEFKLSKEKEKFNRGLFEADLAKRSVPEKVRDAIFTGLNTARAAMTSFDLSAPLRQGAVIAFAHPIRALKAFPAMLKAMRSEQGQFEVNREIQSRPNAELYRASKLHLNDPGSIEFSKMEEAFMSRLASKIPGISHSERAYTTFLNRLRADSFDAMAESVAGGRKLTIEEAKAISNFVNVATGRGNLAAASGHAISLNTAFFAPRYVVSRFELLAGQPLYRGTAGTRIAIAKEYARFLAGIGTFYALSQLSGATVEKDPRSSDFGKLKFGNTRVDPLAGLSQATVLATRLAKGETKTASGVKSIRGSHLPFGQPDTADVAGRFLRTKLSPILGTALDLSSGKDVAGNPVTPAQAALRLAVPLSFGDIYNAMQDQGVAKGTALSILAFFGMGVQTFGDKSANKVGGKKPD